MENLFYPKTKRGLMIKLRVANIKEADLLLRLGIRAFSHIIPSSQIEREKFIPVNQCLKCYQFSHKTRDCQSQIIVCSKCATHGHTYKNCSVPEILCLNCNGPHTAISLACPMKKAAQKEQAPPPPPQTQPALQNTSQPPRPRLTKVFLLTKRQTRTEEKETP